MRMWPWASVMMTASARVAKVAVMSASSIAPDWAAMGSDSEAGLLEGRVVGRALMKPMMRVSRTIVNFLSA